MESLPSRSGDSFLLFVLCGEAPCCRSSFTFSTCPAWAARVSAVSPSAVTSSMHNSWDADQTNKSTHSPFITAASRFVSAIIDKHHLNQQTSLVGFLASATAHLSPQFYLVCCNSYCMDAPLWHKNFIVSWVFWKQSSKHTYNQI